MVEIEYRTADSLGVRFAERIIDLIAAPYNEPTSVFRRKLGRFVEERFAPGAFTGVSGDVLVNRAHDLERPIGRVVKFHPNDTRGLRTEIRVSKTSEGDDLLELAADDLLSASVGFTIPPDGEVWTENRSKVTVTKAGLRHIAMTGDPAYTGAKVLAVRSGAGGAGAVAEPVPAVREPTPNLDRYRLEVAAAKLGLVVPVIDGAS